MDFEKGKWLVYGTIILFALIEFRLLWLDFTLFGRNTLRYTLRTLRIAAKGRKVLIIIVSVISLILGLTGSLLSSPSFLIISYLAIAPIYLLSISHPPAVLLLGSSCDSTVELLDKIKTAIWPIRVCVLLSHQAVSAGEWKLILAKHNLRIYDDVEWRSVVRALAETALIIVMDLRVRSQGVREEVEFVTHSSMLHKTVFHVGATRWEGLMWMRGAKFSQIFSSDEALSQWLGLRLRSRFRQRLVDTGSFWLALFSRRR